jgi:hypothetical protein
MCASKCSISGSMSLPRRGPTTRVNWLNPCSAMLLVVVPAMFKYVSTLSIADVCDVNKPLCVLLSIPCEKQCMGIMLSIYTCIVHACMMHSASA